MIVSLKNIYKDYFRGKLVVPVLKDISLDVEKGEFIAIMGPSGSGKTTLMNIIGCLDKPTKGQYLLDGNDVSELSQKKAADTRNKTIGFVFQNADLMAGYTAVDNVALPLLYAGVLPKERKRRAHEALEKVGLSDRTSFKPNQLSGGQSQRVAIARAIVTRPPLILADEPTGALDSAAGKQVISILNELNAEGTTIIMITHEREVAEAAQKIMYIRDGILSPDMG